MNTKQGTLLRAAYFIATGICLTLQMVLKRKLIFRTSKIPLTPGYAVMKSGFPSSQSFIFTRVMNG